MKEIQTENQKIQNKSQLGKPGNPAWPAGRRENGKIYNIRERLLVFGRRMLKVCRMLPNIPECERIKKQLSAACTSIGANFEEADGALTKKDFVNKVGIARKEAKETRFWLKAVVGIYLSEDLLCGDIKESEELIKILSAILRKSGATKKR